MLYRATVTPANPGYTDAEVSLQELIDDGVLVPEDEGIDWGEVIAWGLMVFITVAVFLAAQTELRL